LSHKGRKVAEENGGGKARFFLILVILSFIKLRTKS
jgi:hypothetical protein